MANGRTIMDRRPPAVSADLDAPGGSRAGYGCVVGSAPNLRSRWPCGTRRANLMQVRRIALCALVLAALLPFLVGIAAMMGALSVTVARVLLAAAGVLGVTSCVVLLRERHAND